MSQQQQQRLRPGDVNPVSGDQVARAEREELVGCHDIGKDHFSVAESHLPGKRIFTTTTGGQVVAQFEVPAPTSSEATDEAVTIGEALEAACGPKPVSHSDAAAIQAAEARATGLGINVQGGIAAAAQAAAEANINSPGDDDQEGKVKLRDVLTADASERLPKDKAVTREDVAMVKAAVERNSSVEEQSQSTVVDAMEAAARMNQP